MPTVFRIIDTQTRLHTSPVELNARELAKLRFLFQSAGHFVEVEEGESEGTALNFEVNANGIALARFATVFPDRDDILSVVEEAQFLGRSLRVARSPQDPEVTLHVSQHITLSPDILLSRKQARAVVDCIGDTPSDEGTISLDRLRSALRDVSCHRRFEAARIEHIHEYLVRLAATDCGEQFPYLEWA
ncbi:hypothetical protein [Novosphingobium sp. HII-3]|uniref:hypothetical protein n=1 Tax=Novosphingobium sp. HII-3 TaxID=2075565 RepID=UPI000CDB28BD|nr:hypothetical protein [Novosphingobium sp. HII-3]